MSTRNSAVGTTGKMKTRTTRSSLPMSVALMVLVSLTKMQWKRVSKMIPIGVSLKVRVKMKVD